jgi:hypothetical protein
LAMLEGMHRASAVVELPSLCFWAHKMFVQVIFPRCVTITIPVKSPQPAVHYS